MKWIKAFFVKLGWRKLKLRGQIYMVYTVSLIVPLILIGVILVYSANNMLNDYYMELLATDNLRVKTLFSQLTTQAYNISDDICFNSAQKKLLSENYEEELQFVDNVNKSSDIDSIVYDYTEIEGIYIYTDNPTIANYKQYKKVTEEISNEEWYQRAMKQTGAFWASIESDIINTESNLSLVRRILLPNSEYKAVVVIKLGDAYIRSRIDSDIVDAISLDDGGIVYSSKRGWYGGQLPIEIDYEDPFYTYSDTVNIDGTTYYSTLTTTNPYMTNSRLYICTLNGSVYYDIQNILNICVLILCLAVLIPGVVLFWFANRFTSRVYLLREEMHKASMKDYNMRVKFSGHDELTEAFEDLKKTVADIKAKDAKMYEAELNEKELRNNQQIMEYKMLASQINPHYLYNTLETIRMKALTMGNKEVADSIKILGKTLQYVFKNTGTSSTTLDKEIEHVMNYLAIQKLRFGNRINYNLTVDEEIIPEKYEVLPLLLQPIVENAVIHGLEVVDNEGLIDISISQKEHEYLQIVVTDNGQGMTEEEYEAVCAKLKTRGLKPESSIGVYNICERIRLHYGEEYGIHMESEYGKGTRVYINLPVINLE